FRTDDGQLRVLLGEVRQRLDVQHVDGDVLALGLGGGAGVAGGNEDLLDARILRDLPGQGVFTAAAADDQYVHFSLPMGAGPRPARWINKTLSTLRCLAFGVTNRGFHMLSGRDGVGECKARVPSTSAVASWQ